MRDRFNGCHWENKIPCNAMRLAYYFLGTSTQVSLVEDTSTQVHMPVLFLSNTVNSPSQPIYFVVGFFPLQVFYKGWNGSSRRNKRNGKPRYHAHNCQQIFFHMHRQRPNPRQNGWDSNFYHALLHLFYLMNIGLK
jgi:hypothetical protein